MSTPSLARRLAPKLAVSILIGGVVAGIAARNGLPLLPDAEALAHVRPWTIPVYVVLAMGVQWFRASRWRFLVAPLRPIALREIVLLNWIGFFAIFALPFRLGEAVRPALTKLRHGVPVSAGVGTIAVERVVDGLVTSLCVAFALWGIPMRATDDPVARHLPAYGTLAVTGFAGAFVALFLFLWQRERAAKLVRAIIGVVSPRLAELLSSKVASVADGVRSIATPRLAIPFLIETLLYWGLNAFSMWALARGCGLDLDLGQAVAIMGVLAIGILLPAGPGMFGSFQLAISAGLACYVSQETIASQGSVFVFLLYGIQAILLSLCGILPLYGMKLRLADVLDAEAQADPGA